MTYKTHLIGGAQAGVIVAYTCCHTPTESALVLGTALIGSVLPDIDYKKSKICNSDMLVKAAAYALSRFTRHRGLTHTLLGALIFAILLLFGATYKTAADSLFAVYAAILVFVVLHVIGSTLGKFGGILAVLTYYFGPEIMSLIRGIVPSLSLEMDAARLAAIGIFAGCISHMIYDTFNNAGIIWLYPLSKHSFSVASIKTRSHGELLFASAMVVCLAILLAACMQDIYLIDAVRAVLRSFRTV